MIISMIVDLIENGVSAGLTYSRRRFAESTELKGVSGYLRLRNQGVQ